MTLSNIFFGLINFLPFSPILFLSKRDTATARTQLPSIINGIISGTAFITGDAAIKYAVTGVITLRISPHGSPTKSTARTIHVLMIGPVMKILRFLNT